MQLKWMSSPDEEYLAANPFKVTVDFAVPEGAQSGDTFTVNFSDKVVGQQSSYSIYDANGEAIAECTTTELANECTFTDYVDTHGDIQGSFDFVVIGQYATNGAGLDWSTGAGQSFHTDTNVRVSSYAFPGKLWKGAWVQNDGSIDYELSLRGSRLGDAGNVVTDSYDPRVVIDRSSFFVNEYVREDANDPSRVPHRVMGEDEYDVVFDDASNTFTVSIPGAVNDEYHAYQIRYSGLVDDSVVDGDVVSNTGTAGDQTASRDVTYHRPSGAGAGSIGNISWKKVDEEGNLLAGAEFQLEGPDGYSETIVDNGELDQDSKDGVFSVGKLAKGDYTLTETKAPEGYELDEDAVNVTLASGGQMTQSAGEIVNVQIEEEVDFEITWTKVDEDGNLLAGAEFQLEGPEGYSETIADNGELDANKADGEFTVVDLVEGEYTLTETKAPEGYELAEDSVTVELTGDDAQQSAGEIVNVKIEEEVDFEITWTKVDEDGNLLAGAEFQLEGPEGYSETIADNGELDANKADGEFAVVDLVEGEYTLTETKAPEGYELAEDSVTVELTGDDAQQSAGEIVNVKSDDESTPCVPCEGGNPEDPEKPEKPENPDNPDKPENPGDTDKPGDSDKPEKPGTPDSGGNTNGGDGNDSPRGNGPGAHANTGGEVQETSGSTPWLLSGLLLAAGGALAMALVVRNRRNTADQS